MNLKSVLLAASVALVWSAAAYAVVTITVPDGSVVLVNPGAGGGGGGGLPPGGGGGGGGLPPDGGGGGTPTVGCLEALHAEKMVVDGHTWTLGGPLGTSAMKDGVMVGGGGSQYVCHQNVLYLRGDDTTYYYYNGAAWQGGVADPTIGATWPLIGVTGTSPNGTKGFSATDSYGHKWTFCGASGANLCRDNVQTGADATQMLFWNNGMYAHGTDNSWYIWTGASWWPWGNSDPSTASPPPTFGPVQPPPSGGSGGGGGGGGGGASNNLPVPEPPSVMPGSSGHVIHVAVGQNVGQALASAQPGDTVELAAGTYTESVTVPPSVLLKGVWTPAARGNARAATTAFDCRAITGSNLAGHGKACIGTSGGSKVQGVEVYGAGMTESASGGTAGIRPVAAGYVYVDQVYAHDNQDGLFGGSDSATAWVISNVTLDHNGLGDGLSHNLYISSGKVTIDHLTSANPNVGHAFKLRGQESTIADSTLDGGNDGDAMDLPDGGRHTLTRVTLRKPAGAAAHNVLRYGEESQKYGVAGVTADGGRVEALCDSPNIVSTGPVSFTNTTFTGNPINASGGGAITGLPGQRAAPKR